MFFQCGGRFWKEVTKADWMLYIWVAIVSLFIDYNACCILGWWLSVSYHLKHIMLMSMNVSYFFLEAIPMLAEEKNGRYAFLKKLQKLLFFWESCSFHQHVLNQKEYVLIWMFFDFAALLSYTGGNMVRAWLSSAGHLLWETVLQSEPATAQLVDYGVSFISRFQNFLSHVLENCFSNI